MAVPTYQAAGATQASISAISVPWPTHAEGDIGLLFVQTYAQTPAGTWPPTGWTLLGSQTWNNNRFYVLWCRATSSAMANAAVGDSGDHQIGGIVTVRGANATGNPIQYYGIGNTTTYVIGEPPEEEYQYSEIPYLSVTTGNYLVVSAVANSYDSSTVPITNWINGYQTNLTQGRQAINSTVGGGGGYTVTTGNLESESVTGIAQVYSVAPYDFIYAVMVLTNSAINLDGTGAFSLAGSAALTTGKALNASVTATLSATAALTTSVTMAAAGAMSLTGVADLETEITLAADAALTLTGEADLTSEEHPTLPLDIAGDFALTAEVDLSTSIEMAGAAALGLTAQAALTTGKTLEGSAELELTGTAELTTGKYLAGTGTLGVTGTMALTTGKYLEGSGDFYLNATASLAEFAYKAEGTFTMTATASLSTPIRVPNKLARFIQSPYHDTVVTG